ncbi:MAG TPA: PAS domain S-box protein [Longimicrobium sp.]|nr:PAS domain S-box protein [Longimicrobium sp.]
MPNHTRHRGSGDAPPEGRPPGGSAPSPGWGAGPAPPAGELELLLEHNPDIIARFDRQLRHVAVNLAVRAATGMDPADFIGRTNRELGMPEEHVARWEGMLSGVFRTGEPAELDFTYPTPRGERWYHARAVPVPGADGVVESVVAVTRDATEARRAAEALRESEERFRQLAENMSLVFWMLDARTGRTLYVSPAYERIWGVSCESLYRDPRSWLEVVHPDDRERALAVVGSLLDEDGRHAPSETVFRLLRADGTVRWVRDRAFPVRDAEGRVYRVAGLAEDITVQRQAAEARRRGEERWRALTENGTDLTSILDERGVIRYVSPSAQRVLGFLPGTLVGVSTLDIMHPDDVPHVAETLGRIAAEPGGRATAEFRLRHADGSWRAFEGTGVNLLDHPAVRGIVTNSRDLTERRRAEAQLRERDEQLLQAQKMEAVGRLAGGIAHDFNNLLTAIKGHVQLLLADQAPGVDREDLEEIDHAADRAANLTRQLLAFSRRQVLQPQVVQLNGVVSGFQRMLRRVIGEDVELRVRLAPDLATVRVDPGQMEQVVMNLAVNARDAMPRGGTLTLETADVSPAAAAALELPPSPLGWVRLCVSDTGEGIDPEVMAHVFEPFYTTKEKGKGTGLGLSTVYGIVSQSGGRIDVESRPGAGATFRIFLPATDGERAAAPARPAPTVPAPAAPKTAGTVLLVEDDDGVRLFARRVLERAGWRVLEARDGPHAIEMARAAGDPIHVLLTDVVMPAMDGKQLAAAINGVHPETRVLYMSGYTDDVIASRGVLDPGTSFLEKPFTVDALTAGVRALLEG